MTPREAIGRSRQIREADAGRWPAPLIACAVGRAGEGRAIEWLVACVGDLLDHLGRSTAGTAAALWAIRGRPADDAGRAAIEAIAWGFWSRRSADDPVPTAVAQLLYALSRGDRAGLAVGGATPIVLLESIEPSPGAVFDRAVAHFAAAFGAAGDGG